jgi:hypothetical protein
MDMHVNEARRDDRAAHVDLALGRLLLGGGADRHDTTVADGHIGDAVVAIGRIDDAAAAQQQIRGQG